MAELSIQLSLFHGMSLFPGKGPSSDLGKKEYMDFVSETKKYLRPRPSGITDLAYYCGQGEKFFRDRGETGIRLTPAYGSESAQEAFLKLKHQIAQNLIVPTLLMKHQSEAFRNYTWHWFLLAGARGEGDSAEAFAVTYGAGRWISFTGLWDTGYLRKGGMILVEIGGGIV